MEWQPIETAPKNGTPIVIGVVVKWTAYKPQARKQGYPAGRWQEFNGYGWDNLDDEPDRWMPYEPISTTPAAE